MSVRSTGVFFTSVDIGTSSIEVEVTSRAITGIAVLGSHRVHASPKSAIAGVALTAIGV